MANDNHTIAPRAIILNRKYRTLVSSWIEPLQEEANVGFEIDYVSRYDSEGLGCYTLSPLHSVTLFLLKGLNIR
jgi:hypothetical protein